MATFMLNRPPRQLPPLALMLDDLGQPTTAALASFLDVDPRTVQRWIARDKMPRASALALFWLTRWGQSIVDAEAVNDARLNAGLAASYRRDLQRLEATLDRLLAIADFGSANSPLAERARRQQHPQAQSHQPSANPHQAADPCADEPGAEAEADQAML